MRAAPAIFAGLLAASCAVAPPSAPEPPAAPAGDPTPFSTARDLEAIPAGWRPYRLARFKKMTQYRLAPTEGTVAMRAEADASASGLQFDTRVDLGQFPFLTWHWKVPELISGANNSLQHVEDSPARVIVTFEGGRDKLPDAEQINYDLAKALSGNDLPYATLMYIWENHLPEGAVIPHHLTTRIKMIVAGSGRKDLGRWHAEKVNVLEDYRRAFGEEPPPVRSVGIMSDSDNTGGRAVAYFGDIRFVRH